MRSQPTPHRIHQSLIRTPLLCGVDKGFFLLEFSLVGSLVFLLGFHLTTLALCAFWIAVVHPLMAWVTAKDPMFVPLYVRSLMGKDYYAPHARHSGRTPGVKPSIPQK